MERLDRFRTRSAVETFLKRFESCAVAPTRRLISIYVSGQLSDLPRKSIMPMARAAGVPARTLQELLSLHRWEEGRMRDLLQQGIASSRGDRRFHATVLEASYSKKGVRTPGVARQSRVADGRVENCVVALHLVLSAGRFTCLLDTAVYLPEDWIREGERRRKAGIPGDLSYRPKARLALEMVDRARANSLVFESIGIGPYAAGPLEPGELTNRLSCPVIEVPPSFLGRAPDDEDQTLCAVEIRALRESYMAVEAAGEHWMVAEFPFVPAARGPVREPWRMLVARPVASGPTRYLVVGPEATAPASRLLETLRRGDLAAREFSRMRRAVGVDHFEVRSYRSLERHFVLSAVSALFLAEERNGANGLNSRSVPIRTDRSEEVAL